MSRTIQTVAALIVICSLGAATQAAVTTPYFNLDIGPAGQDVEAGFVGLTGAPGVNTNGTNYGPTGGYNSLTGDILSLTIDNGGQSGGIDWRDRGNGPAGALVDIGEDFVKNNSGFVALTITGLSAGTYEAVSWHYDPGFTQSDQIEINIGLSGGGTLITSTDGDASVGGGGAGAITTAKVDSSKATFMFDADGINPVTILWDGTPSSDNETPVNGIQLSKVVVVPEPVTATLGLFGLVGLSMATRRRRA